MQFRWIATATAGLCASLAMTLFFFPVALYWLFGVEGSSLGDFFGRRAGFLFVILSGVAFAVRDLEPSHARNTVGDAFALGMLGLAVLGTIEWARGFAGPGIFVAVAGELVIALLFLKTRTRVP